MKRRIKNLLGYIFILLRMICHGLELVLVDNVRIIAWTYTLEPSEEQLEKMAFVDRMKSDTYFKNCDEKGPDF